MQILLKRNDDIENLKALSNITTPTDRHRLITGYVSIAIIFQNRLNPLDRFQDLFKDIPMQIRKQCIGEKNYIETIAFYLPCQNEHEWTYINIDRDNTLDNMNPIGPIILAMDISKLKEGRNQRTLLSEITRQTYRAIHYSRKLYVIFFDDEIHYCERFDLMNGKDSMNKIINAFDNMSFSGKIAYDPLFKKCMEILTTPTPLANADLIIMTDQSHHSSGLDKDLQESFLEFKKKFNLWAYALVKLLPTVTSESFSGSDLTPLMNQIEDKVWKAE